MRSKAAPSIGGLLLCLGVALLWTSAHHWHPTAELWQGFIFRDAGHVLTVADALLGGAKLYQDIFYQYGPLPIYLYVSAAAALGNSPATLLLLQQALTLVVVALAYRLVSLALSRPQTVLVLIVGLFPLLLIPGSLLAGFAGLDYVSLERILLLAIALAWRPPRARTAQSAIALGGLLGCLQLVKFGSAFVAGAALLLVDLLFFREITGDRSSVRKWLITNLTVLGVFTIVEGAWAGAAFGLLPDHIAWDTIWPYFLLESYNSYVFGGDRWPRWQNVGYFVVAQLPAITALSLFAYSAVRHAQTGTSRSPNSGGRVFGAFAFLAAFFLIGLAIYFKHVWHTYQYVWMIMLAAGWGLRHVRFPVRAALFVLWLPAFAVSVKVVLPPRPAVGLVRETFPSGDRLWLEPSVQKQLAALGGYLHTMAPSASGTFEVMFFPDAGGLHHFFQSPPRTRLFWFTGALVQPGDETQFLKDFSSLDAVVVFFPQPQERPPIADPLAWSRQFFSRPAFGDELTRSMAALLAEPVMIDERCWVFPLRREGPEASPRSLPETAAISPGMRTREDSNFKPSDP